MASREFDIAVIGGGPAGYVCAIRASQLGFKVACIDKRTTLGGTCLNVGCIPSKALLHSSHLYDQANNSLKSHGIEASSVKLNLGVMQGRKDVLVDALTKGVDFLFKKNKIERIVGIAKFEGNGKVTIANKGKQQSITAKHIVIATGSVPASIPGVTIDEKHVVSSTGALALSEVPKHLVVIGGGYIGLEMGSVWQRLGAKVTVVEFLDSIVTAMDKDIRVALHKSLKAQGMEFKLSTKVVAVEKDVVKLESVSGGDADRLKCDKVLVAVGRKPYTEGLGLSDIGVKLDEQGRVEVNGNFATNVPGVYAIGDVIRGPMLAHKGEEEGIAVAEIIAGQKGHVNYDAIPAVIFTHPEVATVGKTTAELEQAGIDYKVGKFPFVANSRAKSTGDTEGFVKILTDARTDLVLGAHIIGPDAGSLIAEVVTIMEFSGAAEDIARTCHAHPTLGEAVKEAALDANGRVIHM